MMLKQTVELSDRQAVFYPGGKNSAVQLGSYQEMVFHRDPANKIAFEYLWSLPESLKFKGPVSEQTFSGNSLSFQAEVGLGDNDLQSLVVEKLKYQLLQNEKQSLSVELSQKEGSKEYLATADQYNSCKKKNACLGIEGCCSVLWFS
ncbi:MAG: hypothetical protein WCI23_03025 [Chlorobiaceae bacterium]